MRAFAQTRIQGFFALLHGDYWWWLGWQAHCVWVFGVKVRLSTSGNFFTGEYFDDAISLQYNRARWYDGQQGRFLSIDTHRGRHTEPFTLHSYLYAGANPLFFSDPSGEIVTLGELLTGVNIRNSNNTRATASQAQNVLNMLQRACQATENIISPLHRHHVKPKYLGGSRSWDDVSILRMEEIVHGRLHSLLDFALKMNGFIAKSEKKFGLSASQYYEKLFRRLPTAELAVFEVLMDVADVFDEICSKVPGVKGGLGAKVRALK
ncbi:MAG: hypothetical protein RL748_4146 [Pseudomonadota bacterium]